MVVKSINCMFFFDNLFCFIGCLGVIYVNELKELCIKFLFVNFYWMGVMNIIICNYDGC